MQRIGVIGASVRAAAQSLRRAGYEPIAADLFGDVDLCQIAEVTRISDYPAQFADWMRNQQLDAWIYTGALENSPELVDELAEVCPLWGNSGKLLRELRDPFWLASECEAIDIAFPETIRSSEKIKGGWLAKSYRHSSGAGISKLVETKDWYQAHEDGWFAQREISGRPCSAAYLIDDEQAWLLGFASHLTNDEPEWGFRGAVVTTPSQSQFTTLRTIGTWLHQLGCQGVVGVDFIDSNNELWLLEINPRYTSTVELHESTNGIDCFHAETIRDNHTKVINHWGKVVYYAKRSSVVDQRLHSWLENLEHGFLVADIPHPGTTIETAQPVLTLMASIPANEPCLQQFDKKIQPVISQLEQVLYGEE